MKKNSHAKHDDLIRQMITDPNYMIFYSGEIQTRIDRGGHLSDTWRVCGTAEHHKSRSKYWYVRYKNVRLQAHRIVYQKFVGELDARLVINHKDGDGLNNSVENLELVTQGENNAHRYRVLGYAGVRGNAKITQKIADKIRKDAAKGLPYSALCAKYKLAKSTVSMIVNNQIWKAA